MISIQLGQRRMSVSPAFQRALGLLGWGVASNYTNHVSIIVVVLKVQLRLIGVHKVDSTLRRDISQ